MSSEGQRWELDQGHAGAKLEGPDASESAVQVSDR